MPGKCSLLVPGITIADEYVIDPPYESIHMSVDQPEQFVIGKHYTMSVNLKLVEIADSDHTRQVTSAQSVGYGLIGR